MCTNVADTVKSCILPSRLLSSCHKLSAVSRILATNNRQPDYRDSSGDNSCSESPVSRSKQATRLQSLGAAATLRTHKAMKLSVNFGTTCFKMQRQKKLDTISISRVRLSVTLYNL